LRDHRDAIVERWLDAALSAYPAPAAKALARRRDRFANPVGHSLRTGLGGILEALLEVAPGPDARRHLREIIRIRAVQQLTAAQAVGFVFGLKDAIRAELEPLNGDPGLRAELAELERRIDEFALAAFEVYAECREHICELRVNEVKRQVAWVMERQSR
jgi:signal transduction histidine kinase